MGNCLSNEADPNDPRFQLRVLVLGAAACGKSTFTRQMKIIFCNGFGNDEVTNYGKILHCNLSLGIRDLIDRLDQEGTLKSLKGKKVKRAIEVFKQANPYQTVFNTHLIESSKDLWADKTFQSLFFSSSAKSEYTESVRYIMENIDRIGDPEWVPTNADILSLRQRTTGVVETRFKADRYYWTVVDVGGQKVERRKWIHSKTGINALIFFVALDEYDTMSEDAPGKTKMEEALDIWSETINDETLVPHLPVILFLNKEDLFRKKIAVTPLSETYKKYKGGDDFNKATEFIRSLFMDRVRASARVGIDNIACKVTCAIDTENIRFVFGAVQQYIFKERLGASGL